MLHREKILWKCDLESLRLAHDMAILGAQTGIKRANKREMRVRKRTTHDKKAAKNRHSGSCSFT